MNKRKIALLAMSACMIAILAIGGTLAYFTDTDEATNVFTTAKVNIDLIEQQRDGEGGLEEYVNEGKVLYPIVGSAQGEKDEMGMPTAKNYMDKIITVKNLDDSTDAYVRVYLAIPSVLDNVKDAGQNILHFNWGNKFETGDYTVADYANWGAETLLVKDFDIDGLDYNVYYRDYNKVMAADTETGSAAYVGFYMDENVDYVQATDTAEGYYTIKGEKINYDFTKGVNIPVFAVGVQSAGFTTAAAAVDAAFGAGYNPF